MVETSQTITAVDRLLTLLSDKFPSAKSIPDLLIYDVGNNIGMKKPECACDYLKESPKIRHAWKGMVSELALIRSSRSSV